MMIDGIRKLGSRIEAQWRARKYSEACFPELAQRGLEAARLHERFDIEEVVRWILQRGKKPRQHAPYSGFGQPPLTVWRSPHFMIELYFWLRPEITIHDHRFCGAFTNLTGNSVECTYTFSSFRESRTDMALGELKLKDVNYLQKGSTRAIILGRKYIHQVWHLSRPTVTMAVRTFGVKARQKQFEYFEVGLAVRGENEDIQHHIKRRQFLHYLFESQHPERYRLAIDFFLRNSIITGWHSFIHFYNLVMEENGPEQGLERVHSLLAQMKKKHGQRIAAWERYLDLIVLEQATDWEKLRDERHRLLIALLRSVPTREGIYDWLRRLHPDRAPDELIVDWLSQMSATGALNLEIAPLHFSVLGPLLRGASVQEIGRQLSSASSGISAEPNQIQQACTDIRETPLFHPLFNAAS